MRIESMPYLSCARAERSCFEIIEVTYCSVSHYCQSCSYYMYITFHERCLNRGRLTYFETVYVTLTVTTELLLYIRFLLLMVIHCQKLSRLNKKRVQVECYIYQFTKTNLFQAFAELHGEVTSA